MAFHLICRCRHGNSEHANKFLSIVLVSKACCRYYVKVNYIKKKLQFFTKPEAKKASYRHWPFINLVREHPCIYDVIFAEYKDAQNPGPKVVYIQIRKALARPLQRCADSLELLPFVFVISSFLRGLVKSQTSEN